MARRRAKQIGLFEPKRAKHAAVRGSDGCQPHIAREAHHRDHPVHVTMRRVAMGPSFRTQRVCAAIRGVITGAKRKGVRVLHYSVQDNHLHLMVEGNDSADLSNQMRTLFSRIAFAVNAIARRHGRLFRDRHHRHELTTPSEVRNALVYILFNDRKHHAFRESVAPLSLDPCSSAWWFEGWAPSDRPPERNLRAGPEVPTSPPLTWLATWGWHRGDEKNLLRFSESPRPPVQRPRPRPRARSRSRDPRARRAGASREWHARPRFRR